jgi:hypothetical protein
VVVCLLDNIRTVVSRGVSVPDQLAVQEANSSWILNAVLVLTGTEKEFRIWVPNRCPIVA